MKEVCELNLWTRMEEGNFSFSVWLYNVDVGKQVACWRLTMGKMNGEGENMKVSQSVHLFIHILLLF
jgi:hypothetical protein